MQNYSGADGVAFYAYTGAFVPNSQGNIKTGLVAAHLNAELF